MAMLFFDLIISTRPCDIRVHRAGSQLKMSNVFDNSWEPKVSVSVTVSVTTTFVFMCRLKSDCLSCCHMSNAYVDPWDMLNNFCFHVYA